MCCLFIAMASYLSIYPIILCVPTAIYFMQLSKYKQVCRIIMIFRYCRRGNLLKFSLLPTIFLAHLDRREDFSCCYHIVYVSLFPSIFPLLFSLKSYFKFQINLARKVHYKVYGLYGHGYLCFSHFQLNCIYQIIEGGKPTQILQTDH